MQYGVPASFKIVIFLEDYRGYCCMIIDDVGSSLIEKLDVFIKNTLDT